MTKSASSDCLKSSHNENEDTKLTEETPETLLQLADTHSEPSIAKLIDLDSISLQETSEQSTTQVCDIYILLYICLLVLSRYVMLQDMNLDYWYLWTIHFEKVLIESHKLYPNF